MNITAKIIKIIEKPIFSTPLDIIAKNRITKVIIIIINVIML